MARILRWALGITALAAVAALALPGVRAALWSRLRQHAPGAASQDAEGVWQYVDAHGSVQFASCLDDVPADRRASAGRVPLSVKSLGRKRERPAAEPVEPASDSEKPRARAATRATAPRGTGVAEPFTLYISSESTMYQDFAPDLDAVGVSYDVVDIAKDPAAKEHVIELTAQEYPNLPAGGWSTPVTEGNGAYFFGNGEVTARFVRVYANWLSRGKPVEDPNVYVTDWCPYSKKLMADLDAAGQPFVMRDIERDPEAHAELEEATGSQGIPVVIVNGRVVIGVSSRDIDKIQQYAHPPSSGGFFAFLRTLLGH